MGGWTEFGVAMFPELLKHHIRRVRTYDSWFNPKYALCIDENKLNRIINFIYERTKHWGDCIWTYPNTRKFIFPNRNQKYWSPGLTKIKTQFIWCWEWLNKYHESGKPWAIDYGQPEQSKRQQWIKSCAKSTSWKITICKESPLNQI